MGEPFARAWRAVALGVALSITPGCVVFGGGDGVTQDARIVPIRLAVLPPARFENNRVVPLDGQERYGVPLSARDEDGALIEDGLRFTESPHSFQDKLVERLVSQRYVSSVFRATDPQAARDAGADYWVRPVLVTDAIDVRADGRTTEAVTSSLLWFLTWVGGMWISDYRYETDFEVHCEFANARRLSRPFARIRTKIDSVDLSFFARNDGLLNFYTLQTFLLPPALTPWDDEDETSKAVSWQLVFTVADRIGSFLRDDFDWQALQHGEGRIRLDLPSRGELAVDGEPMRIVVERRDAPIDFVSVTLVPRDETAPDGWAHTLNDSWADTTWVRQRDAEVMQFQASEASSRERGRYPPPRATRADFVAEQAADGTYRVEASWSPRAGLYPPGDYTLIVSATGDHEFTRTRRVRITAPRRN